MLRGKCQTYLPRSSGPQNMPVYPEPSIASSAISPLAVATIASTQPWHVLLVVNARSMNYPRTAMPCLYGV